MGLFDGTALERPVVCERCGRLEAECACSPAAVVRTPPSEQTVRLAVEKRSKGKAVTVVRGLTNEGEHLSDVLAKLKSTCGAGGTVKEGQIEIQGRQVDSIRAALTKAGYRVRE